jgi:hypothetical protein
MLEPVRSRDGTPTPDVYDVFVTGTSEDTMDEVLGTFGGLALDCVEWTRVLKLDGGSWDACVVPVKI